MNIVSRTGLACLLLALALFAGSGTAAQAACLSGSTGEGKAAAPLAAVVPDAEVGAYTARGFAIVACPDQAVQKVARDSMCAAAKANEAVQARVAAVMGERPDRLCASASAVLGEPQLAMHLPANRALDGPVSGQEAQESPPLVEGTLPLAPGAAAQPSTEAEESAQ